MAALGSAVLRKMAEKLAPADWKIPSSISAVKQIKADMHKAHLLIEVRDARVPFSSSNFYLQSFLKYKPHIVVFTKSDLADPISLNDWKSFFGDNYYFVNANGKESVYTFTKMVKQRLLLAGGPLEKVKSVMLLGLPNVGKTSLANTMHRLGRWNISMLEKFTLGKVDIEPYTTQAVSNVKINYFPAMYVLDTPSVMVQRIHSLETGLKLALTGSVPDKVIGPVPLARFVLAMLNDGRPLFHSRWKAQYLAHTFISKTRDITKRLDRRLMGSDDHAPDIRGLISSQLLSFEGNLEVLDEMDRLVHAQFNAIKAHYQSVAVHGKQVTDERVARRLLSLYRVGKLGCHTLDALPERRNIPSSPT